MRRSSTWRITVLIGLTAAVLAALAGWWNLRTIAAELHAREVQLVRADLDGFADLYEQRRIIALRQSIAGRDADPARMIVLLLDKKGARLAGNVPDWPDGLPVSEADFDAAPVQQFSYPPGTDTVRYIGMSRNLPGGFPVLVARAVTDTEAILATLRWRIAVAVLGVLLLGLAAGYGLSRMILGRIDRVNRLCLDVQAGDLNARIPGPRTPDEFGDLEQHVHNMLDRIGQLTGAVHQLGDHIAHELRTPLNRIRQKIRGIETAEDVAPVEAEIAETIRIFDALLDINAAEAETGDRAGLVPVNLSEVATDVHELYEAVAEERGITFRTDITAEARVLGDRNLLMRLSANLIDNALKFTPKGGEIQLATTVTTVGIVMQVADTGPGIPADASDEIFKRFVRVGRQDSAGHGLGLALVRAIALRHGAKIDLPRAERGFSIRITWPSVTL